MRVSRAGARGCLLLAALGALGCEPEVILEGPGGSSGTGDVGGGSTSTASMSSSGGAGPGTGGSTAGGSTAGGSTAGGSTAGGSGTGGSGAGGSGCTGDADCAGSAETPVCDPSSHACVECVADGDCAPGSVCVSQGCAPGCNAMHPCGAGLACCDGGCFDLESDESHCGSCEAACPAAPGALSICAGGACSQECIPPNGDCNGDPADGCEHNTLADGPCVCEPGSIEPCYSGAPGTLGVGPCKAGERTCAPDGLGFGPCEGAVLPSADICGNGVDDDCDGTVDSNQDQDGDGWGICDGDCDDNDSKVNPGAYERTDTWVDHDDDPSTPPIVVYTGNGLDDDCDPATPDFGPPAACSPAEKLTSVTALDLARALDLCQDAGANPPKSLERWGLLEAELVRSDGSAPSAAQMDDFQNAQTAVLSAYGVTGPVQGPTFAGLSTGMMRAQGMPGYVAPSPGTDLGWPGSPPAAYTSPHGGALPSSWGCNGNCPSGSDANDAVSVRLKVRVPTNVIGFSLRQQFFTAEYPLGVCSLSNDFFLGLCTSATPALPADRNVFFDALGNPISVNNGYFTTCAPSGCSTCEDGAAGLAGTGMSAATGWRATDVPVVPAEVITLELMVMDVGDGLGDSVALVDGFQWLFQTFIVTDH